MSLFDRISRKPEQIDEQTDESEEDLPPLPGQATTPEEKVAAEEEADADYLRWGNGYSDPEDDDPEPDNEPTGDQS